MNKPVWLEPGPAAKLYAQYLSQKTVKEEWLAIVRARWSNFSMDWNALYPQVQIQAEVVTAKDDKIIPVTTFIPPTPANGVIIYLHGGGWIAPASGKHQAWAQKLAYLTHMRVLSVDYSLAPENPFPIALYECVAVLQKISQEFPQQRIIIVGDSAGGNLAAATTLYCSDHAIRIPDKLLCLCPVTDIYFEKYPSVEMFGINNPYFDAAYLAFERAVYLPHSKDWSNPYACPMMADLSKLPPTLVLAAAQDPLCDENKAFAEKIKTMNVNVRFFLHESMPHTFYQSPQLVPEAAALANQQIVDFILEK